MGYCIWQRKFDNKIHGCEIFVDFQKPFDTVDHGILIQKLNYYRVRGVANNYTNQVVSIDGFDIKEINCGVPKILSQGLCYLPLGSLLLTLTISIMLPNIAKFIILLMMQSV